MRTFHLPMSEALHEALKSEAQADQRPATEIVREALSGWLQTRKRQRIAEEIQRYAEAEAGTASDIDRDLEAAGLELLRELE